MGSLATDADDDFERTRSESGADIGADIREGVAAAFGRQQSVGRRKATLLSPERLKIESRLARNKGLRRLECNNTPTLLPVLPMSNVPDSVKDSSYSD